MFERLPAFVPKAIVIAAVGVLATGGITYAAEQKLAPAVPAAAAPVPVQQRATLVVPDLRRQAFVFAKGQLQDAGFSWRVVGSVHGYAANVVVSQSPTAGVKVFDTGAPLIKLTLSRNRKYVQAGAPEDIAPFRASSVQLAEAAVAAVPAPAATTTTTPAPAATTPAPAATTPAPAATTPAPAATTPAPAAATTTTAAPEKAVKPLAAKARFPQSRPAAFAVAGAPKEPLDEMPLVDRANALGKWLSAHPKATDANVRHWLYQNEWIVTGAKFGWWRGAEALQTLIAVDRRAGSVWGIGSKSEAAAAHALTEVEARTR